MPVTKEMIEESCSFGQMEEIRQMLEDVLSEGRCLTEDDVSPEVQKVVADVEGSIEKHGIRFQALRMEKTKVLLQAFKSISDVIVGLPEFDFNQVANKLVAKFRNISVELFPYQGSREKTGILVRQ